MKNPQNLKGKGFDKHPEHINKNGRPRKLPDLDSLLIDVLGERVNDKEALKSILIGLRKKAIAGDVRAAELLLDRAYGKLKQQQELSGIPALANPINIIVSSKENAQKLENFLNYAGKSN